VLWLQCDGHPRGRGRIAGAVAGDLGAGGVVAGGAADARARSAPRTGGGPAVAVVADERGGGRVRGGVPGALRVGGAGAGGGCVFVGVNAAEVAERGGVWRRLVGGAAAVAGAKLAGGGNGVVQFVLVRNAGQ